MLPIDTQVLAEARRHGNGSWTFEGKDTHGWLALAEHQRHAAERLGVQDRADANEAYMIASRLRILDIVAS